MHVPEKLTKKSMIYCPLGYMSRFVTVHYTIMKNVNTLRHDTFLLALRKLGSKYIGGTTRLKKYTLWRCLMLHV